MINRIVNFLRRYNWINTLLNKFSKKNNYESELKKLKDIINNDEIFISVARNLEAALFAQLCDTISKEQARIITKEIIQAFYLETTGTSETINDILQRNNMQMDEEERGELELSCEAIGKLSILFGFYIPFYYFLCVKILACIFNKIQEIENGPLDSRMTVGELYDILKTFPEKNALRLCKTLRCSSYAFDCLIDSFKKNKKNKFVKIIHSNAINISEISAMCYYCQNFPNILHLMLQLTDCLAKGNFSMIIKMPAKYKFLEEIQDNSQYIPNEMKELRDIIHMPNSYDLEIILHNIDVEINGVRQAIKEVLREEILDELTFEEKIIKDKLVKKSSYANIYDEILNELELEKTSVASEVVNEINCNDDNDKFALPDDKFTLPDDYWKLSSNKSRDAYIRNTKYFKASDCDVTIFITFIYYIAEEGYIDSDPQTLASFAFHLTGIHYPEDFSMQKKIIWKKDARTLFYIVKYISDRPDKFQSLKVFFESNDPDFEKAGSSYADRVRNLAFKKKMYELYPRYFPKIEETK